MRDVIRHAIVDTSLGRLLVAVSKTGVCEVSFGADDVLLVSACERRFPRAEMAPSDARTRDLAATVAAAVESPATPRAIPLDLRGTPFQRAVWDALREIPAGATITYGELARRAARPAAVRAAAQACGANPVAVIVPCHRVIGADGSLTGYASGIERKRALLDREGAFTS
ncbi:MAG TPA: methylated-DNA--[protein]-cysteine S-methyltransferase [Coriobacteriia bacterium]|nr:methylated-DNA--[protein]-cysteine S-methyltransferase [Coriobacteriia bacterium]